MHSPKAVLVIGAAGKKAGLVVLALAQRGLTVRALIRREEQRDEVWANGATQVAIGDLRDRESLNSAMDGATGLFYIAPAFQPDEVALGEHAIACARSAGIERVVFSMPWRTASPAWRENGTKPSSPSAVRSVAQATIMGYADCFGLLGVVLLAAIPCIALMRKGAAAGGTAH